MLRVILQYKCCSDDGKNVFNTLAIRNVEILKTRQGCNVYPRVTIRIKDNDKLNQLVSALNKNCSYEVRVVKVKPEETIADLFKKLFKWY